MRAGPGGNIWERGSNQFAAGALSEAQLRRAVALKRAIELREDAAQCEASLHTFLVRAWPQFDSSPFLDNWHLHAICQHLEAVSNGQIKRLLINVPPRSAKTNLVAIAWPVWTWCLEADPALPLRGPGVRFLCASYGANKAETDGVTARRLLGSTWFQERWGHRCMISKYRDNQSQYDTEAGGFRISTGIPESLGKGGAIRIVDDPTKPDEVESDYQRENTLRAYREVWRTRSNDPVNGAEVIIMQRLHQNDLSGHVLAERDPELVHLMLPQEYDADRHCRTVIGFDDPRHAEGELLWPARFPPTWVERERKRQGEHAWSGQQQQSPNVRGGGIIAASDWKLWPPDGEADSWYRTEDLDGKTVNRLQFPELSYVLLSADTAYSEKDEADWSAAIALGVFEMHGMPKVILLEAWRERLALRPLVLKLIDMSQRRSADGLAIEMKASGISVVQEIRRLVRGEEVTIFPIVPKGDKVARLHAASPAFSAGIVYAPDRAWADMVIEEVAAMPRGRHDDLCFAAGTLIAAKRGKIPIEQIKASDQVLTPKGWRKVLAAGLTGFRPVVDRIGLIGTQGHPVYVLDKGWVSLDSVCHGTVGLTLCDLIQTIRRRPWNISASPIASWEAGENITSPNQRAMPGAKALKGYMSRCGKLGPVGLSRLVTKSITSIATPLISAMRIWSAYRKACIGQWLSRAGLALSNYVTLPRSGQWPRPGMDLMLAENGIVGTWLSRAESAAAACAGKFVASNDAFGAAMISSGKTKERSSAAVNARSLSQPIAGASNVRFTHTTQPVYNLTVDDAHCYYANGILVHNCDCLSQGINQLRKMGLLRHVKEVEADTYDELLFRGNQPTVRESYGV